MPTDAPPSPHDVQQIAGRADPVVRNLQITLAYYDISTACHPHVTTGANWCTFAAWASAQAGHSIRGEDLVDNLKRRALLPTPWLAVAERIGKWFVRRGLFNPDTRLGRLAVAIDGPLQGLETASRVIAEGNRKVFEEIGYEFARFLAARAGDAAPDAAAIAAFCDGLRPGPPPDGQDNLKAAFRHYYSAMFSADASARAQLEYLGNLLIGFHEQIRLQPQIQSGMTDPVIDEVAWGMKLVAALVPGAAAWWTWVRTALAFSLRVLLKPLRRVMMALVREVVTEQMMTLTVVGRQFSLARPIPLPASPALAALTNPDLLALMASVPPAAGDSGNVGAADWADLGQRMRYIAYLFRVYHQRPDAYDSPFTDAQIAGIRAGGVPDGRL